jgi:hypothetical protein
MRHKFLSDFEHLFNEQKFDKFLTKFWEVSDKSQFADLFLTSFWPVFWQISASKFWQMKVWQISNKFLTSFSQILVFVIFLIGLQLPTNFKQVSNHFLTNFSIKFSKNESLTNSWQVSDKSQFLIYFWQVSNHFLTIFSIKILTNKSLTSFNNKFQTNFNKPI